jgi:hypothetical protein
MPLMAAGVASDLAACTIVARNYLAQARVLGRSFLERHPGARMFVLVIDQPQANVAPASEPFEVLRLDALGIEGSEARGMCFQYGVLELSTAVKPFLLEHLLTRIGLKKVLYIDPDVLVMAGLDPLFERLDAAPLVLTPHSLSPLPLDGRDPDEVSLLRSGAYNLGFIGLSNDPRALEMLAWWKERCRTLCVARQSEGLFVDQKWIDLVPCRFDVSIVRDPGYNVAYWNLHERRVTLQPSPTVNGQPLRFFHFSGHDPRRPDVISKYQTRFRMDEIGEARELFARYGDLLRAEGFLESSREPYGYARFATGEPIAPIMRDLCRTLDPAVRAPHGDPFATGPGTFHDWMHAPAAGERSSTPYLSNLAAHARLRPESVDGAVLPRYLGDQRDDFVRWLRAGGYRVLGLDEAEELLVAAQLEAGASFTVIASVLARVVARGTCRVCALKSLFGSGRGRALRGRADAAFVRGRAASDGRSRVFTWAVRKALNPCERHHRLRSYLGEA